MSKGQKNFRTEVDSKLAMELLNVAPQAKGEEAPLPLGKKLKSAVNNLAAVVQEANEFLADSNLATKLAEALAADKNKRGFPTISVDANGAVVLEVDYDAKRGKKKKRQYSRRLPLLADLRKEAAELGVDVSHLGQKRRAVYDFLEEVKQRRAAAQGDAATSPAAAGEDPEPMSAGADEVKVTAAKDGPKPPRRRKVKLTIPGVERPAPDKEPESQAQASPNLTAIMENAPSDVDIDSLLDESNGS